jgi:hypothetical protein
MEDMDERQVKLITGTNGRVYAMQYDDTEHREKMGELGIMSREVEFILRRAQLWRWEQMMADGTLYEFVESVAERCHDSIINRMDSYRETFGHMQMMLQIPQIRSECLQEAVENAGIR